MVLSFVIDNKEGIPYCFICNNNERDSKFMRKRAICSYKERNFECSQFASENFSCSNVLDYLMTMIKSLISSKTF